MTTSTLTWDSSHETKDAGSHLDNSSEVAQVRRAILRDPTAFSRLYEMHAQSVEAYIRARLRDPFEAEDLCAQTFLKAWENIDKYDERGRPFAAWLLRIARNLTISHLRSRKVCCDLDDVLADQTLSANPLELVVIQDEAARVRKAMFILASDQRRVLHMRFLNELDYPEVAVQMGRSVSALRVIQHRALERLRKHIGDRSLLSEKVS